MKIVDSGEVRIIPYWFVARRAGIDDRGNRIAPGTKVLFSPMTGGIFTGPTAESDALAFEIAHPDEGAAAGSSRLRICRWRR